MSPGQNTVRSLLFATPFFLSISEKCSYIRDCSCIYIPYNQAVAGEQRSLDQNAFSLHLKSYHSHDPKSIQYIHVQYMYMYIVVM